MVLTKFLHLDPTQKAKSTRDGYGEALLALAQKNPDVVVLTADLRDSTRTIAFSKAYPDRFFDTGVAEQNLAGVSAGLALSGLIPFMSSFGVFSPGRNWDQIRVSICYSKANVKIASTHTGLGVGEDGASHQALEDIAIARVLPNMTVIAPGDAEEARKVIFEAAKHIGPMYIRLGKQPLHSYTTPSTPFSIGDAYTYVEGSDVTLCTTGSTLECTLQAAEMLEKDGIHAEVIHVPTIKPIDAKTLIASFKRTGCGVSVEDHQVMAGFGSAVLEAISHDVVIPFEMVGMQDTFGESGPYEELFIKYLISPDVIVEKAKIAISRKNL